MIDILKGLKALMTVSTGPWPILGLIAGIIVVLALAFFPKDKTTTKTRVFVFLIAALWPSFLLVYVLGKLTEDSRFPPLAQLDNSYWRCVTDEPGEPPCHHVDPNARTRDAQIEVTAVTLKLLGELDGAPPTQGQVRDAKTITNGDQTGTLSDDWQTIDWHNQTFWKRKQYPPTDGGAQPASGAALQTQQQGSAAPPQ